MLEQNAGVVIRWLAHVRSRAGSVPDDFNWLGLAFVAAARARGQEGGAPDRAWAVVAVSVYDDLTARADDAHAESMAISSMMLRAEMVRRLGPVPGDPVLDPSRILQWFLRGLWLSREEALERASAWATRPIGQIRELRRLKNRLNVIEVLSQAPGVPMDSEIEGWLALRHRLP